MFSGTHKVEKLHPEGKNVRRTHIQTENGGNGTKYSGKATSPKEEKKEETETKKDAGSGNEKKQN